MKNLFLSMAAILLALTSCGSNQQFAGTMIGAHVGGVLGSAIFGGPHNHGGSIFGDVIGTVAGAAIGAAVTAPQNNTSSTEVYNEVDEAGTYTRPSSRRYSATTDERRPSYKLDPVKSEESKAIADLKVKNLRFIDQNRNRVINSNESCQLVFDVVNDGHSTVRNITPYIYEVNESTHIYISKPTVISELAPGESVSYTIRIMTDKDLQAGKATFCIELSDDQGLTIPCREFDLETAR